MAAPTSTTISKTIFRKEKRKGFTTIDNAVLDDKTLSFKALGLLCFLLSKPDNWRFNYRHITTTHTDGEAAVRSGMQELEKAGYLSRERERQQDGTLAWVITVREEPKAPCGGFPRMDDPGMENPDLVITEGPRTEEVIPLLVLSEEREQPKRASEREIAEDFETWWQAWTPSRRVNKADARAEYLKARKDTDARTLLEGAEAFARLVKAQGTESKFIPHPGRWIKKRRWEDDVQVDLEAAEREANRSPFESPTPMRYG